MKKHVFDNNCNKFNNMELMIVISLVGLLLSFSESHFAYANFTPAQEAFIKDNRPKPNVMFVLDSSSIGLDNEIMLSTAEKAYFKKYLTAGQSTISKTEAVAIAYQKLLDEYWHVAHFGLGKVVDKSAHTYTMYPKYKKRNRLDESQISAVIIPFLDQDITYAGNYQLISKAEHQHNQSLRNELQQFHTKHSTPFESRRAWVYSLVELYKYASGLPFVESIAEESVNKVGLGRINFTKKYGDPMKFICQNSFILYSPVDISRDITYVQHGKEQDFDAAVGLDNGVGYGNVKETIQRPNGSYTDVRRYYQLSTDLYKTFLDHGTITNMLAQYLKLMSNNYHRGGQDNATMLVGSAMMQHIHPVSGKDLAGNNWSGFNGHPYDSPRYNPTSLVAAQTYISGVYFGDPIIYNKNPKGRYTNVAGFRNELQGMLADLSHQEDYSQRDYLINFLQPIFTYHYDSLARYQGNGFITPPNTGVFRTGRTTNQVVKQSYTRANSNEQPTLMSVYLRHKEYLDDIVIKSKSNGRYFTDQHIRDPYDAYIDTTFEVTHNEQFWTSNIKAKRLSVPDQKGECQIIDKANRSYTGAFTDNMGWWQAPDVEPTWETAKAITENQGDFFTSRNGNKYMLDSLIKSKDQVAWLKGKLDLDPEKYRVRNHRLGDIVNSSIRYVAKDHLYVNLALVGKRDKYTEYMFLKHKNFYQNLIVAGSNDGFLNFIVAGRNHKNQPLQRRASYFVPFFIDDTAAITKPLFTAGPKGDYVKDFTHRYRVDGKINLFDAFVEEDTFKTIGIAGMGPGYQGLVGFQLFAATKDKKIDNEIKPLFEITKKSEGFEELGYTYSDFAFVNIDGDKGSQAVAVFGNGPGGHGEKSLLYFINANTGQLIGTIDFTKLGGKGGAFSPTLVVDKGRDAQILKNIYVGDYSGKLFKVEFTPGNLEGQLQNDTAKTMVLFDASVGNNSFNYPIITRPYVVKEKQNMWIYFSTGGFLQAKDREDTQANYLYALRDKDSKEKSEIMKSDLNVVSYPDGYKATTGDRELRDSEKGWMISLAMTDKFIKDRGANDLWKVKNDEIRSSKMIHSVVQNGTADLAFTTRSITPRGDSSNYCNSDIVYTAVSQVSLLTGKASVTYEHQLVGRNIIPEQGLFDGFRTYGTVRADSQVANNDSGINLNLKPEERAQLDEHFSYDMLFPKGSCPNVWTSAFAESSNIGGRHLPSSRTSWSWPNMSKIIYYPAYNWGFQTFNGGPSKNFSLQLPASGMFGQNSDRFAFQLGSILWVEPPKLTPKRLSIRKIQ